MNKRERVHYYLGYTAAFFAVLAIAGYAYYSTGTSLAYRGDGTNQHLKALAFYGKWLRSFFLRLITFRWKDLPFFTFGAGYGSNVIGTFSYYVLGDPFALLSAFTPAKYMVHLYTILIVLRLYVSGILFARLCFYQNRRNKAAILCASLCYVFFGYSFCWGVKHPFFLNGIIYLPLVVLGVEKALQEKKFLTFILAVWISACSNFYFFYMIVLYAVIYVLWRVIGVYGNRVKDAAVFLLKLTGVSVAGLCMAMPILMPTIHTFLGTHRGSGEGGMSGYIRDGEKLLDTALRMAGSRGSIYLSVSGIALLGMAVILVTKGYFKEKILILIAAALISTPVWAYIASGFSYESGRWSWPFSFLASYLLVLAWDEVDKLSLKKAVLITIGAFLYLGLAWTFVNNKVDVRVTIVNVVIAAAFLWERKLWSTKPNRSEVIAVFLTVLSCGIMGAACYSDWGRNFVIDYVSVSDFSARYDEGWDGETKLDSLWGNESYPVAAFIGSEEAFRYSGRLLMRNTALTIGSASTQFYWSLGSGYMADFLKEIGATNAEAHSYVGLQSRFMPLALLGVKYYYAENKLDVPYGYRRLTEEENPMDSIYPYYVNESALPFGILFDHYISEDTWQKLTMVERQQALLQGVKLQDGEVPEEIDEIQPVFTDKEIPITITALEGAAIKKNGAFKVKKNGVLHITLEGEVGAETYLSLENLRCPKGSEKTDILYRYYYSDGQSGSDYFRYMQDSYKWSDHKHDFILNLGQSDSSYVVGVDLVFLSKGTFTVDKIRGISQSVEKGYEQIQHLAGQNVNFDMHSDGVTFSSSRLSGRVSAETDSVLFLSMSYDEGWKVSVDSEAAKLLRADTAFTAIYMPAGTHTVEMTYCPKGLKTGILLCFIGLLLTCIYLRCEKRNLSHSSYTL